MSHPIAERIPSKVSYHSTPMFELLGVIDLRRGRAVHASGGRRERYLPVERVAGRAIEPGSPQALADQYVRGFRIATLYVADLDAIEGGSPQEDAVGAVARAGAPLWLDAGVTSVTDAQRALEWGAARAVVGLETLASFDVLGAICAEVGGTRVAFSLDLRHGKPMAAAPQAAGLTPSNLATRAVDAGVGAVIVLDVSRVGMGAGLDLALIERVRAAMPTALPLVAGGGVSGVEDLIRLRDAGCSGALVATALLTGRLTADEIARL
jgi:phosphoribosylformimino-5-aminoimidazole carboxamide ribotide isomerase